jgi:hypothetical protein
MSDIVTTDLAEFGFKELHEAGNILKAYGSHGLEAFEHDGVKLMFNTYSGYVFLTNSDCQVAMMNGNNLELFFNCPECGHEGFKDEMQHKGNAECARYLDEIGGN